MRHHRPSRKPEGRRFRTRIGWLRPDDTGMATDRKHPPTSTINRKAGDVAVSSQDTQKQMQGQPTAAQQAQGAKPDEQTAADKDC